MEDQTNRSIQEGDYYIDETVSIDYNINREG